MIVQLTPETYFDAIRTDGPLHVVMHYGETCGPCKATMPHYEVVVNHFTQHNVTNVKFYKFHQWDQTYKEFIEANNLKVPGVPTFRYIFMNEVLKEDTSSYNDANILKQQIVDAMKAIETTMGEFNLYAS